MRKGETIRLTIESLGTAGDGRASADGRTVFAPFALPGEIVDVRLVAEREANWHGEVIHWERRATERATPPCPHFGDCGGCALQHLEGDAYARLMAERLNHALASHGLDTACIQPMARIPAGTRRRTRLAAHHHRSGVALGYRARGTRWVVDIAGCGLLTDQLARMLTPIREVLLDRLPAGQSCEVSLCETDTGVDMVMHNLPAASLAAREELAAFAGMADLARLSVEEPGTPSETIVERRTPVMRVGGMEIPYPAGAFLQPSAEGEAALRDWVSGWLGDAARIADLYAGLGGLTAGLAATGARVHAVEGDNAMMGALATAAGRAGLGITTEARDIARQPLAEAKLRRFDAVVFDPPRAGARAQAEMLATSEVPLVAAVSCNAATFGRDAAILTAGGYMLDVVHPLDQFPYSPHVELAALFRRP